MGGVTLTPMCHEGHLNGYSFILQMQISAGSMYPKKRRGKAPEAVLKFVSLLVGSKSFVADRYVREVTPKISRFLCNVQEVAGSKHPMNILFSSEGIFKVDFTGGINEMLYSKPCNVLIPVTRCCRP